MLQLLEHTMGPSELGGENAETEGNHHEGRAREDYHRYANREHGEPNHRGDDLADLPQDQPSCSGDWVLFAPHADWPRVIRTH